MLFLNFSLLVILWIYYRYGLRWALVISSALSFWMVIFILRGLNPWMGLAMLSSFNIAVFIPYAFDKQQAGQFEKLNQSQSEAQKNTRELSAQLQKIKEEKDNLEKQSLAIIDLYETSKKMALVLSLPELFKVLAEVLDKDKYFIFRNFKFFKKQFEMAFQKINLYEKIQDLAITDGLTQVYVRRHFEQRLQEESRRSQANNMKMAVLLIDLDHFKEINDRYGHLVGDAVLKDLSAIVKESVRSTDLVGRWGGEELIVLLVESDINLARLVAERIRQLIENNIFRSYDETVKLTISIGISIFPDEAKDISALLEKADKALYRAKGLGRNRVYTPLAQQG